MGYKGHDAMSHEVELCPVFAGVIDLCSSEVLRSSSWARGGAVTWKEDVITAGDWGSVVP